MNTTAEEILSAVLETLGQVYAERFNVYRTQHFNVRRATDTGPTAVISTAEICSNTPQGIHAMLVERLELAPVKKGGCKLEALHNYVILKINKREAKKGSIHLPESAVKDQADFAEVISVGPKCEGGIEVGNLVLCPEVGDTEWTDEEDEDQQYMLIEETAIAAKVKQ